MLNFNSRLMSFVGGLAVARRYDLPSRTVLSDGLIALALSRPVIAIALVGAIAKRQADSLGDDASNTGGTGNKGATGYLDAGSGSQEPSDYREFLYSRLQTYGTMPNFHHMSREQAEQFATLLGLKVQFEGSGGGNVIWQEPGIGKVITTNVLRLRCQD
jgi:hypothetical protein